MHPLMFIDTNILLDFYRARGDEGALSLLDHIDSSHDRIITTSQVEMEYKKNRQSVIISSLKDFKGPDANSMVVPAFLSAAKPAQGLATSKKAVLTSVGRLRTRIETILKNPSRNDPVFKVAQRLFASSSPLNLTRSTAARRIIRRRAFRRFILGYPPRKQQDTSMGDAVNWEWIIDCATESGRGIVIVSRDSDYGHAYKDNPILNDWLVQEFRERVSKKRKLYLTARLTEGLRLAAIRVSKKEERQEEQLITEVKSTSVPTDVKDVEFDEIRRFLGAVIARTGASRRRGGP